MAGEGIRSVCGRVPGEATSDRAEAYAVAAALAAEEFRDVDELHIFTDSAYVITSQDHFEEVLASAGDSYLNGDIFWFIARECLQTARTVKFYKVAAHTGVALNKAADRAAKGGNSANGSPNPARDYLTFVAVLGQPRTPISQPVRDEAPMDIEIANAVMKLKNFKTPG